MPKLVKEAKEDDAFARRIPTAETTRMYLREAGSQPRLTTEQEVDLAKKIEAGKRAQYNLLHKDYPSRQNRARDQQRVIDGTQARRQFTKANLRLVISLAKKKKDRDVSFQDLIQEGNIGLITAVDGFNWHLGYKFSTYAIWWINQAMGRAIANQDRDIRLPAHVHDRLGRVAKVSRRLEQELCRQPTDEELAREMHISVSKIQLLGRVSKRPFSLEEPAGIDTDTLFGDFIEDDSETGPEESAGRRQLTDQIETVMKTLNSKEENILRLRFGFKDGHDYTLEETGAKYGVSRERIRQIEKKAMEKIRQSARGHRLKEFLP